MQQTTYDVPHRDGRGLESVLVIRGLESPRIRWLESTGPFWKIRYHESKQRVRVLFDQSETTNPCDESESFSTNPRPRIHATSPTPFRPIRDHESVARNHLVSCLVSWINAVRTRVCWCDEFAFGVAFAISCVIVYFVEHRVYESGR